MTLVAAVTRDDVASYVSALILVYIVLIFIHILLSMLFSFGMRMPYARWTDAVLHFLRDICEPYLRLFRRFIPPLGAFDLSPMVAIIVLYIVRVVLVNLIAG
ncbi:MAG TPA: YggT family protein [Solirubrobacteraceae bacterium]|nr:YggT family protein [Solirubrobacteraceae bacterium]